MGRGSSSRAFPLFTLLKKSVPVHVSLQWCGSLKIDQALFRFRDLMQSHSAVHKNKQLTEGEIGNENDSAIYAVK